MRIRIGAGSSEIVEIDEIESSNDVFGFGSTEIIFRWVFFVLFCGKNINFVIEKFWVIEFYIEIVAQGGHDLIHNQSAVDFWTF